MVAGARAMRQRRKPASQGMWSLWGIAAAALLFMAAAAAVRRSLKGGHHWVQPQALGSTVQPDAYGSYRELVYFGIDDVDRALDCPAPSHGCFYAFHDAQAAGGTDEPALKTPAAGCAVTMRNCNRHGECNARRPWCIVRRGIPPWLTQRFPGRWRQEPRPTYLFSRVDLLNPTHLTALHYLPLVRWLQAAAVQPGQVLMLWDDVKSAGPREYGLGLAAPLGETAWLPELPGPIVFRSIRLGEYGDLRFPYHLKKHELSLQQDAAFTHLSSLVKAHYRVPQLPAMQPRVVIARRRRTRVLANAEQVQAALEQAGMQPSIVDFAALSFEAQVHAVADAAVLISVHGADCMNLMFLPPGGSILEIAPTHYGYGYRKVMRKGDYFNLARLLGKQHLEFVSTSNSTLLRDDNGQLVDWNHVNFVGDVNVDVAALLPVVQAATMAACGPCYQPCGPINQRGEEECVPEQAVP